MFRSPSQQSVSSICTAVILVTCMVGAAASAPKPDIEGKVVLANLDRYESHVRFGKTRRTIKPRKASILKPKMYPATIEFWSGNTKVGWVKQSIPAAGVYGFNFKLGNWKLAPLKQGKTSRPIGTSARPRTRTQPGGTVLNNRTVVRQSAVQRPLVGRRLPMRRPINASRARWSPLARVAWAAGSIYQFVRDEQDRDLLRDLLVYRRLEDIKAFERWLDESDLIALPHKEAIREAFEDLADLTDAEWKAIEAADDKDWDKAKAELGDLISEDEWKNLTDDFEDIETGDYWEEDGDDVDLDEVEFADNLDVDDDGDIDFGDGSDLAENIDIGDVGIDAESYDLGEFDDFGGGALAGVGEVVGDPGVADAIGDVGEVIDDFGGGNFDGGHFFGDDDMGDFGGDGFDFAGDGFDDFGGDDFDF